METTPITAEEFHSVHQKTRTGQNSPLSQAVLDMQPGTGFKVPCTMKHDDKYNCRLMSRLYQAAHRSGFKISGKCQKGTLYVFRIT